VQERTTKVRTVMQPRAVCCSCCVVCGLLLKGCLSLKEVQQQGNIWHSAALTLLQPSPNIHAAVRQVTEELTAKIERLKQLQQQESGVTAADESSSSTSTSSTTTSTTSTSRRTDTTKSNPKGGRQRRNRSRAATVNNLSSSQRFIADQIELLTGRRKRISHHLLARVQRSYATADCSGHPLNLLDTYLSYRSQFEPSLPLSQMGSFTGFPAGCGDCCAPKLLHAAAQRGWHPVSLVEFFYGAPPGTATKAKGPARIDLGRGGGGASIGSGSGNSSGDEHEGSGSDGGVGGAQRNSAAAASAAAAAEPSRQHGDVYGMCDKCRAILGTMLHGLEGL